MIWNPHTGVDRPLRASCSNSHWEPALWVSEKCNSASSLTPIPCRLHQNEDQSTWGLGVWDMARPRQLDAGRPSNWRSGRVRPESKSGTIRGAGDVREQRGHEAQQGMLVSTEMERMKKIPREPHWEWPWRFHCQPSITINSPFLWHLNYSRVQIREPGVVWPQEGQVRTLTLTHSRCR